MKRMLLFALLLVLPFVSADPLCLTDNQCPQGESCNFFFCSPNENVAGQATVNEIANDGTLNPVCDPETCYVNGCEGLIQPDCTCGQFFPFCTPCNGDADCSNGQVCGANGQCEDQGPYCGDGIVNQPSEECDAFGGACQSCQCIEGWMPNPDGSGNCVEETTVPTCAENEVYNPDTNSCDYVWPCGFPIGVGCSADLSEGEENRNLFGVPADSIGTRGLWCEQEYGTQYGYCVWCEPGYEWNDGVGIGGTGDCVLAPTACEDGGTECPSGSTCNTQTNTCVADCTTDAACLGFSGSGSNLVCNGDVRGTCTANGECYDFNPLNTCDNGCLDPDGPGGNAGFCQACIPSCGANSCGQPDGCGGICSGSNTCPTGQTCEAEMTGFTCTDTCTSNCNPNQYPQCSGSSPTSCVEVEPGCFQTLTLDSCLPNQYCNGNNGACATCPAGQEPNAAGTGCVAVCETHPACTGSSAGTGVCYVNPETGIAQAGTCVQDGQCLDFSSTDTCESTETCEVTPGKPDSAACVPTGCTDECQPGSAYPFCSFGEPTISTQCQLQTDGCYDVVEVECDFMQCNDGTGLCENANPAYCGNGIIETGETCDDGQGNSLNGPCSLQCETCTPPGQAVPGTGGVNVACAPGFDVVIDDFNADGCYDFECVPSDTCGNTIVEPGEQCEYQGGSVIFNAGTTENNVGFLSYDNLFNYRLDFVFGTTSYNLLVDFEAMTAQLITEVTSGLPPSPSNYDLVHLGENNYDLIAVTPEASPALRIEMAADQGSLLTCSDFRAGLSGPLSCNPTTCELDISQCTGGNPGVCGDGVLNTGEQCDFGGGGFRIWNDDESEFFNTPLTLDKDGYFSGTVDADLTVLDTGVDETITYEITVNIAGVGPDPARNWVTVHPEFSKRALFESPLVQNDRFYEGYEGFSGNRVRFAWPRTGAVSCTDFDDFTGGNIACNQDCTIDTSMCTGPFGGGCYDSDFGNNPETPGETSCIVGGDCPIFQDTCRDGTTLLEGVCTENGQEIVEIICLEACITDETGSYCGSAASVCGDGSISGSETCDVAAAVLAPPTSTSGPTEVAMTFVEPGVFTANFDGQGNFDVTLDLNDFTATTVYSAGGQSQDYVEAVTPQDAAADSFTWAIPGLTGTWTVEFGFAYADNQCTGTSCNILSCVANDGNACGTFECSDGIDNDGDGFVDFTGGPNGEPADPGCMSPTDDDENIDTDGDGCNDDVDISPTVFAGDSDGDGFGDHCDNCVDTPNPDQADSDGDGIGDACETNTCDPAPICAPGFVAVQTGTGSDSCPLYTCNPIAVCGDNVIQPGEECEAGLLTATFTNSEREVQIPLERINEFEYSSEDVPFNDVAIQVDVNFKEQEMIVNPGFGFKFASVILDLPSSNLPYPYPIAVGSYFENIVALSFEEADFGPINSCSDLDDFTGGTLSCSPVTCLFNTSMCEGPNTGGFCGDGIIQVGEDCDGNEWGPITSCTDLDSFTGGILTCGTNCNFDTSACIAPPGLLCGNGIQEGAEQCDDGNNVDGDGCSATCTTEASCPLPPTCGAGFVLAQTGVDGNSCATYTCNPVAVCGDGLIQPGEECDTAAVAVSTPGITQAAFDGVMTYIAPNEFRIASGIATLTVDLNTFTAVRAPLEQGSPGSTLDAQYTLEATGATTYDLVAGNTAVEYSIELTGDFGPIASCTDLDSFTGGDLSCNPQTCLFNTSMCEGPNTGGFCGDGIIQVGEDCDGDEWGPIAACSDLDTFGNGILSCGTNCNFNTTQCIANPDLLCGNSVVDTGETCDDGNTANGDGCSATCQIENVDPNCGNGVLDPGEQCDPTIATGLSCTDFDDFTGGDLTCTSFCQVDVSACTGGTAGFCGNGLIDAGEQCDGTNLSFSTCTDFGFARGTLTCNTNCQLDTSACQVPSVCGNGIVEFGEECDDGNDIDTDTCRNFCVIGNTGGGGGGGGGGSYRPPVNVDGGGDSCDQDLDGYYNPQCTEKEETLWDCNDRNPFIHPFAFESCNEKDDDCDGQIDEGCFDDAESAELIFIYGDQVFDTEILSRDRYTVRVENKDTVEREVEVYLDLPESWEYHGPQSATIPARSSESFDFDIIVGPEDQETLEFHVEARSPGYPARMGVRARVDIPFFTVKAMPSFEPYVEGDVVPVYVVINPETPRERLQVEFALNRGRSTLYVELIAPVDPENDGRVEEIFIDRFDYPAEHVAQKLVTIEGELKERGREIATSTESLD